MTSLHRIWQRVVTPPKSFTAIKRAEVLVIDGATSSETFFGLIPHDTTRTTLHARNELLHLNIRTVALTFNYMLKGRPPWLAYVSAVIRQVGPRVAVTYTDNAPYFHEVAGFFSGIDFVAVQNGNRFPYTESCLPANRDYASVLLTFGEHEMENYREQNTRFREIKACGSLKNSLSWSQEKYDQSKQQFRHDICFVSSAFSNHNTIWHRENELLAIWLSEYLWSHEDLSAAIAMKTGPQNKESHELEISYYRRLFGDRSTLIPRMEWDTTYTTTDKYQLTISSGTTISIESLSRGNRSLICHPLYKPRGPLEASAPFILETAEQNDFFVKVDEFLDKTDNSFGTEYRQSIDYFCHSPAKREIDSALAGYFNSSGQN